MRRQMTIAFSLFGLLALIALMAACNTVKGAGQDVSSAGGHVEHAAENSGASHD